MKSRFDEGVLICPQCGYSTNREIGEELAVRSTNSPSSFDGGTGSVLKVVEADKIPNTLPTTNTDCPKCGNNLAFWWMLQTRSADEATTQFYRCTQCNHTWRNYS
jgi:DNA-directed RNA polymerase subunit M